MTLACSIAKLKVILVDWAAILSTILSAILKNGVPPITFVYTFFWHLGQHRETIHAKTPTVEVFSNLSPAFTILI